MKRERLGVVSKSTFDVPDEIASTLADDEARDLAETIEVYRRAGQMRKQVATLTFPETVREVLEYVENGASESEKKVVITSLLEAMRVIRKLEREEHGSLMA
ncbi:hypothetical protein [Faunimonas pinastri]|uniref:hypothetical protein n=1 Tax=Faunimonas pinastri TaxID=1855383 RepID=UPI000B89EB29|nr:hypothetical protein [Faunimonas pinastri]